MASFEESYDQITAEMTKATPTVGTQFFGIATHLADMHNFYIVPLSLYRLMSALEQAGRPIEQFEEHSKVVYRSPSLDMKPVRGVIRAIEPNGTCSIFALDYGLVDMEVTRDNIFQLLHEEAGNVPGLAQLCELAMCFPYGGVPFGEDAIKTFKFFMGQPREKLSITVKEVKNYKLTVEIISSNSNPDTVSMVMAYCKHSALFCANP